MEYWLWICEFCVFTVWECSPASYGHGRNPKCDSSNYLTERICSLIADGVTPKIFSVVHKPQKQNCWHDEKSKERLQRSGWRMVLVVEVEVVSISEPEESHQRRRLQLRAPCSSLLMVTVVYSHYTNGAVLMWERSDVQSQHAAFFKSPISVSVELFSAGNTRLKQLQWIFQSKTTSNDNVKTFSETSGA